MKLQKLYAPIIKTGDAELKALANLSNDTLEQICPIIELTRGRKSKNDIIGTLNKRLDKLKKINLNHFFIDITSDELLSNIELEVLHSYTGGYHNWCDFCKQLKQYFPNILPVIQIEECSDYDVYIYNLCLQVKRLLESFDYVLFRSQDEKGTVDTISDINAILLKDHSISTSQLIYLLDYKYIKDANTSIDSAMKFIEVLNNKLNIHNIILSSTSFPNSVSEIMEEEASYIELPLQERSFFSNVKQQVKDFTDLNLLYSDYASINPNRNDTVIMARGWIPRIDVPTLNSINIMRKRRGNGNYANRYKEIAVAVCHTEYFKNLCSLINCWGIDEITNTAQGIIPSASPQFWISIRMNIYISLFTNIIPR